MSTDLLAGSPAPDGVSLARLVENTLGSIPRSKRLAAAQKFHPDVQRRLWANRPFARRVLQITQRDVAAFERAASLQEYVDDLERRRALRKPWDRPVTEADDDDADDADAIAPGREFHLGDKVVTEREINAITTEPDLVALCERIGIINILSFSEHSLADRKALVLRLVGKLDRLLR